MLKYKRLQVGQIWLRTPIEIAAVISASVACALLIISSYENTYARAADRQITDNTAQYAHSLSVIAPPALLAETDPDREDFIKASLTAVLDSTFIEGDTLNAGAIYRVTGGSADLFARSAAFDDQLAEGPAADLASAASGRQISNSYDNSNYTFLPLREDDGRVYGVVAVSSVHRDSLEYDSLVLSRVKLIAMVGGGLILVYYTVSGIISARKKRKAVTVGES